MFLLEWDLVEVFKRNERERVKKFFDHGMYCGMEEWEREGGVCG